MDYNEDEYHALCAAIGFIVINWSLTEQTLDGLVSLVFHRHGGKNVEQEIPRALAKKIEFLKKCFKKIESLSSLRDSALEILQKIDKTSKRRHDLVHGAIASMASRNGIFEFVKLDYEKQMHVVRSVHLDLTKFDDLATEILDLGVEAADLAIRLEALR